MQGALWVGSTAAQAGSWLAVAGSKCVGPLGPVPASAASAFWCEGPGPGACPWPRDSSPPQGGALLLAGWQSALEASCCLFGGGAPFFLALPLYWHSLWLRAASSTLAAGPGRSRPSLWQAQIPGHRCVWGAGPPSTCSSVLHCR